LGVASCGGVTAATLAQSCPPPSLLVVETTHRSRIVWALLRLGAALSAVRRTQHSWWRDVASPAMRMSRAASATWQLVSRHRHAHGVRAMGSSSDSGVVFAVNVYVSEGRDTALLNRLTDAAGPGACAVLRRDCSSATGRHTFLVVPHTTTTRASSGSLHAADNSLPPRFFLPPPACVHVFTDHAYNRTGFTLASQDTERVRAVGACSECPTSFAHPPRPQLRTSILRLASVAVAQARLCPWKSHTQLPCPHMSDSAIPLPPHIPMPAGPACPHSQPPAHGGCGPHRGAPSAARRRAAVGC
jgi:hypothetical protein